MRRRESVDNRNAATNACNSEPIGPLTIPGFFVLFPEFFMFCYQYCWHSDAVLVVACIHSSCMGSSRTVLDLEDKKSCPWPRRFWPWSWTFCPQTHPWYSYSLADAPLFLHLLITISPVGLFQLQAQWYVAHKLGHAQNILNTHWQYWFTL